MYGYSINVWNNCFNLFNKNDVPPLTMDTFKCHKLNKKIYGKMKMTVDCVSQR